MFKRLPKTPDSKLYAQLQRGTAQADGDGCLHMAPEINKEATTTGAARRLTPVIGTPNTQRSGRQTQLHITDQHQHFASILTRHIERARLQYEDYESTLDGDEEPRIISAGSTARSSLVGVDDTHGGLSGRVRTTEDSSVALWATHAPLRRGSLAASAWRAHTSGDGGVGGNGGTSASVTDSPSNDDDERDSKEDSGGDRQTPTLPQLAVGTAGATWPQMHQYSAGVPARPGTCFPLPSAETSACTHFFYKTHSSHAPLQQSGSPRRISDQSCHSRDSATTASSAAAPIAIGTSSSSRSSMGSFRLTGGPLKGRRGSSMNIPVDFCGRVGTNGGSHVQKLLSSVVPGCGSPSLRRRPASNESCVGALSMIGTLRRQDPANLHERLNGRQRQPHNNQAMQNLRPFVAWTMK